MTSIPFSMTFNRSYSPSLFIITIEHKSPNPPQTAPFTLFIKQMEARRRYQAAMCTPCPNLSHSNSTQVPMKATACSALPTQGNSAIGDWNCQFWQRNPNQWSTESVKIDHSFPDQYDFERYRYQMYAKPSLHQCQANAKGSLSHHQAPSNDRHYVVPQTDIRSLQQTMYIPVVPSDPVGVTEATFPMTPQTLGQPDVTSACCVPVIPSHPGHHNLTQGILPGPCPQTDGYLRSQGHSQGKSSHARHHGACPRPSQSDISPGQWPCSQDLYLPNNVLGNASAGLPGQQNQRAGYDLPCRPPTLHPPVYDGSMGALAGTPASDQEQPQHPMCLDVTSVRHSDIERRRSMQMSETPLQRRSRLTQMYGSFGSYLVGPPKAKRHLTETSSVQLQGNGFQWCNPRHTNHVCYVMEKNQRC